MKKIILITAFLTIWLTMGAQIVFRTDDFTYCEWNEKDKKYNICVDHNENTAVIVNEDDTYITHILDESITVKYFVTGNRYDEEYDVFMYDVTEVDSGDKGIYIFDIKADQIRVVMKDDTNHMFIFYIAPE